MINPSRCSRRIFFGQYPYIKQASCRQPNRPKKLVLMTHFLTQEWKNTLSHLRLHFSLLLMPVFLFALSQAKEIDTFNAVLSFLILHLLVYPSSNLFNGYYDNDTGSVGGLKEPPPSNQKMLILANYLDCLATILSFFISSSFAILVFTYIVFSRLYSYRYVRLKQYPGIGFFVIFIFQGAFTFIISKFGVVPYFDQYVYTNHHELGYVTFAAIATSFQIGAIYPLTQIYQHESDLADEVVTLSYKLGYRGTFLFSAFMFAVSNYFYYLHFKDTEIDTFHLLMIAQTPIALYFTYWAIKVCLNSKNADYKHTMRLSTIAATSLNLFFLYLILK